MTISVWAAMTPAYSTGVIAWLLVPAALGLVAIGLTTSYVARKPYTGGHCLVGIVALFVAFGCVVSWMPLLAM
jgi:hypothetical protein